MAKRHRERLANDIPEYVIWCLMKDRCFNPNAESYKLYGGRGIRVCDEWNVSFDAFFAHIGPRPTTEHQIDRIDNNKGYEPGNVRWATRKEQCRNRRSNRLITCNGQTKTLAEWAEVSGIDRKTISDRIDVSGWSPEQALSTPVGSVKEYLNRFNKAQADA